MNRMPATAKGARIISDHGLPENDLKKMLAAIRATNKSIAPMSSCFHAMTQIPVRINTGILWIRKPRIFLPDDSFPSKTSNENIIIKRSASIIRTLGVQ